jgi:hypothetical protein
MIYNIINIDLSTPRVNQVYNLFGNSIKVLNATSDCFIQFDDTTQDPINLLLVDEIKVKFKKFYLSNVGVENKSIKIVVSDNFNLNDRISITDYIKAPIHEPIPDPTPEPIPDPTPGIPFLPGFGFRIPITIPHTKVINNEVNCPVYIKLRQNNFDFTKARNDGFDVCFTQDDGQTLLDFERDRHDNINLKGDYMVKIPNIASSVDNKFFMYYGNPAATDISNPTAVWDINYVARWSLKEDPAGLAPQMKDSTLNNNHGTSHGGMTSMQSIEGQIDKALNFDGIDDYIDIPAINVNTNKLTVETWVKPNVVGAINNNVQLISKWSDDWAFGFHNTDLNNIMFVIKNTANIMKFTLGPTSVDNTTKWYHIVGVYDGSNITVYIDNIAGTPTAQTGNVKSSPTTIRFGEYSVGGNNFNGIIDEVRISNIGRSASWIDLQYKSQKDTLLTFGPEELA